MPPSSELLVQRVSIILDNERANLRVHAGRSDIGSKSEDGAAGFTASIDPLSITTLRRFAKHQAVVQQLSSETARPKPRRSTVSRICFRSHLSGVVRYITGAVDTLQVNDIFGQIAHYRAPKLHVTSLDAVSKALWLSSGSRCSSRASRTHHGSRIAPSATSSPTSCLRETGPQ